MKPLLALVLEANPPRVSRWRLAEKVSERSIPTTDRRPPYLADIAVAGFEGITHVGVTTGPASYVALRQVVATANALAWALDRPLFAVPPAADLITDLPRLLATARVGVALEPVYPTSGQPRVNSLS